MKKLFFPKASTNGGENCQKSPRTQDKKQSQQTRWKTVGAQNVENMFQTTEHFIPVSERKVTEKKTISRTRSFVLRRSQSFQVSSAIHDCIRVGEQDLASPRGCKNGPSSHSRCDSLNCDYQLTNRDSKLERVDIPTIQLPHADVLHERSCSCPSISSSPRSSSASNSLSGKVLDLYVDDENHQKVKLGLADRYPRGSKENMLFPSGDVSRDHTLKSEKRLESPRKLAKDVVERLIRIEQFYDSKKPRNNYSNLAMLTSTVYNKHLDKQGQTPEANTSGSALEDILDENLDAQSSTLLPLEEDSSDLTLQRRLEELNGRARRLSVQLAEGRFPQCCGDVSKLCQTVRNQIEEERNLVLEIYEQLQNQIADRINAKAALSLLNGEMNSAIVKLMKEKDEVESRLQKELDRRSDEWDIKLREFHLEEGRLRDRIRELTEQNVCLQKEISGFYNKEKEYTDRLSNMEVHLKDLAVKMDVTKSEKDGLQERLSDMQDELKVAEEVQLTMDRKHKEKETEHMELIKLVAKLQGMCTEQERTIGGLRHCLNSENLTNKLQIEFLRLTGVEQDLRKQLETISVETNSLRSENIYLLERLKTIGEVSGSSALKLEQELLSCVKCLQKTGLSLLDDCIRMCENLLGIVESKTTPEGFLETHSLVQYGMKIQGFSKGLEQLTRSLGKTTSVLKQKAEIANFEHDLCEAANEKVSKDEMKSELEAERLLTSILKEKLYSKEKEGEHMQAELARALRSDDALKREIQDAADTLSCVNHKMKNLELQLLIQKTSGYMGEFQ
ncbi:spindle pole body component 110-like isoform X2 [Amaranthus tricolor]|uniref:spindle pole body component 110-like isoform X2 n=1 Tax=Amaranthus tricolor TaxID=29722 RepID=UPI00258D336F|nr:spindle pole body component 110-like isoform X2 [Amaranthus tricolor]